MAKGLGKGYTELSDIEKQNIAEDFKNGEQVRGLISKYNTTRRAIPAVLKEFNINTKRRNRYTLNENYFEIIDSEHKAYWLGFIAADGCITSTNYFAIALKDEDILQDLKNDLEYTGDIYIPQQNTEIDYYRINFSSKKLCDDLRKYGICENKSFVFNSLPDISDEYIKHFIRGYFDGDGCVYMGRRTNSKLYDYRFNIIATYEFCTAINNYLSPIINYEGYLSKHSKSDMWYYQIYKREVICRIYEYLYNDSSIYLKRKYDKWQEILGSIEK